MQSIMAERVKINDARYTIATFVNISLSFWSSTFSLSRTDLNKCHINRNMRKKNVAAEQIAIIYNMSSEGGAAVRR